MTKVKPGLGEGELKLCWPPQPEVRAFFFEPLGAGPLADDLRFLLSTRNGTGQPCYLLKVTLGQDNSQFWFQVFLLFTHSMNILSTSCVPGTGWGH